MKGVLFRGENEKLSSNADVLHKTSNLVIPRCCFADDGEEIDKNEKKHVQSVQSCSLWPLNMQICDVLVDVAVVVAKAPWNLFVAYYNELQFFFVLKGHFHGFAHGQALALAVVNFTVSY